MNFPLRKQLIQIIQRFTSFNLPLVLSLHHDCVAKRRTRMLCHEHNVAYVLLIGNVVQKKW